MAAKTTAMVGGKASHSFGVPPKYAALTKGPFVGVNSKGKKGIFPSNYVCISRPLGQLVPLNMPRWSLYDSLCLLTLLSHVYMMDMALRLGYLLGLTGTSTHGQVAAADMSQVPTLWLEIASPRIVAVENLTLLWDRPYSIYPS